MMLFYCIEIPVSKLLNFDTGLFISKIKVIFLCSEKARLNKMNKTVISNCINTFTGISLKTSKKPTVFVNTYMENSSS